MNSIDDDILQLHRKMLTRSRDPSGNCKRPQEELLHFVSSTSSSDSAPLQSRDARELLNWVLALCKCASMLEASDIHSVCAQLGSQPKATVIITLRYIRIGRKSCHFMHQQYNVQVLSSLPKSSTVFYKWLAYEEICATGIKCWLRIIPAHSMLCKLLGKYP